MALLKINLLPREILLERLHSSKITFLNKSSVALLIILAILTSATLGIRFLQSTDLEKANQFLVLAQGSVTSQSGVETQQILLKKQLDSIDSLSGKDDKRKAIFNLVVALIPADIKVSDATVDKNGNMSLTLSSESLNSIDSLLLALSNPEKNLDLISRADLDGFSVGKDGTYRFGLKMIAKQK